MWAEGEHRREAADWLEDSCLEQWVRCECSGCRISRSFIASGRCFAPHCHPRLEKIAHTPRGAIASDAEVKLFSDWNVNKQSLPKQISCLSLKIWESAGRWLTQELAARCIFDDSFNKLPFWLKMWKFLISNWKFKGASLCCVVFP